MSEQLCIQCGKTKEHPYHLRTDDGHFMKHDFTPPAPAEPQPDAQLIKLIKLGTTRFSRDRGLPDATPAFPYEVAFAMGNWEQFVLGIKGLLKAAEQRATRAALEATFKVLETHWLYQINCDLNDHTDKASCACGWTSEKAYTVGGAAKLWIEHIRALSAPAQTPSEEEH